MSNLDALMQLADDGLSPFAEAIFEEDSWPRTMAALAARSDWAPYAARLIASSQVAECVRSYPPKERCVLELLVASLGKTATPQAIATLTTIAARHPQRELRIYAIHGLLAAGPAGVDAAAGPPNDPPEEADSARARPSVLPAIVP